MLRVASFFFWSHRSHFQKFASAPGFINDRAANRSASRSSRPDQNHHYHDQMVLRGKRPPFLTSSPTATRHEDFVGLPRALTSSEMVSKIHSSTFSDLVTVIDISRRGESTKGHATTPNDIFRKLQPTQWGLAPHHAPTSWGRPQRVGVNPP